MTKPTDNDDPFKLTDTERHSQAWARIRLQLEARLDRYRAKLEGNLQHDETTKLRGRIAEIRNLLAAGESQD